MNLKFSGKCNLIISGGGGVILSIFFSLFTKAQTNYSPLYTSANFTKTIDLNRPVGTISGSAGTNGSGGVIYSIPIYTPPGTNGVQPSVSVTYNSQGGTGVAGYGWSISGLSVISRGGKDMFHENKVAPIEYLSQNPFLLDGLRLNPIQGVNADNGTIYAGETESFTRIVSYTGNGSIDNPDWFLVTAKDGSTMEFGKTTDSRIIAENGFSVMMWRLNRIIDINGNYIDFKYYNGRRDSRIDEINYTGNLNTGLQPYNQVKFIYDYRSDNNTVFEAGASLSSAFLLNQINIKHTQENGVTEIVKVYDFKYGFDNIHSLLKEVVESGLDGLTPLNSTIFLYGDPVENTSSFQSTLVNNTYDIFPGDFDANGVSDLLAVSFTQVNGVKKHTGYSIISDVNNGGGATVLYSHTLPDHTILGGSYNKLFNFLAADYNKDGRDDVLYVAGSLVEYGQTFIVENVVLNTSGTYNSQTGTPVYTPHFYNFPVANGYEYRWTNTAENFLINGDFDGDGNHDYILIVNTRLTSTTNNYKAFFNSPAKNEFNLEIYNFGVGPDTYPGSYAKTAAQAKRIVPIDFDGDGKMELLITRNNITYILSLEKLPISTGFSIAASVIAETWNIYNNCVIYPGDFNGDRKTDVLVHFDNNTWNILFSNGKSYTGYAFAFNQPVAVNGFDVTDKILVADFNGDGKSDILHGYDHVVNGSASTSKLSLYYSKGLFNNPDFYYEQYSHNTIMSNLDLIAGDFNSDGRADFLGRFPSMTEFIKIKPNGQERLLKKVTDGHNTTTSFEYKNLTDKQQWPYVYNRTVSLDNSANQNPFNYIELPIQVVSSVSSPDGIGGANTTSYFYEDAVIHRAGKGFLGFKKVIAKNSTSGITAIAETEINTQFVVPYNSKQTTLLTATNQILSESFTTNSFVDLSTGNHDKRYFHRVDKTLSIDHLNGTASESNNSYDSYGNITTSIAKVGTLSGNTVLPVETTTTTTTFGIHNTLFPAKPDNITIAATRTGMPAISSTATYTYAPNGLPQSQTSFAGLPKAVTTTYAYNSFGNPTQTVTSASGISNRTSTATFDAKGRYPLTKSEVGNAVTQTQTYTYDGKWGKPLSHKSSDCLTTTFEYNGYGMLKKTNLPEGYSVNNSLVWDVQGQTVFYALTDFPGGRPDTKTWMDKLGRQVKKQIAGFGGQWLTQLTTYNNKGQATTQTNNYYPAETPLVTTTTYDVYGRAISALNSLTSVTTTYSNLAGGRVEIITQNGGGQTISKIIDAAGKTVSAIDNGGQLDFTYDSRGNQVQTKHGAITMVTSTYDVYGRQLTLTDKNAGTINYQYDAYGQLIQQTDAIGNTYMMAYDDLGRIISRQGTEGITTYEYYYTFNNNGPRDGCQVKANNNLVKITGFNNVTKEYTYDNLQRVATEKTSQPSFGGGYSFTTSYGYDVYGNNTNITYPSGVVVNNLYDASGGLLSVSGGDSGNPVTLFTANAVNGSGQYTSYTLGNGKTSQNTYTQGIPTRFYTPAVQDLNFSFDLAKGNLNSRYDALKNITETFQYDNLNRLTTATVNGAQQLNINYDGNSSFTMGNITSKTDAGNYVYNSNKIHAVAYITNPAGPTAPPVSISPAQQTISYTPFLKTASINEGGKQFNFTYGPDYQRVKMEYPASGFGTITKYYMGNYEKVAHSGGGSMDYHYVNAGNGLCAVIQKSAWTNSIIHFVYTDYLGSLLALTDQNGTITAEQNFDSWGRERNPGNWQYWQSGMGGTTSQFFDRGYTGHEHLNSFALINMNGRMYDPIQGRMLSPDNYVPNPWSTQGYNRYSYANNNPLVYTDPDGNFPWLVIAAALYSGVSKGIASANRGMGFLGGFAQGFAVGGGTAAIGAGINLSLAGSFSSTGLVGSGFINGAISGSVTGGLNAMANGTNIFSGIWKGGLFGGLGGAFDGFIRRVSVGAISEFSGDQLGEHVNTGEIFSNEEELENYICSNIGDAKLAEDVFKTDITLASTNNLPQGLYVGQDNLIHLRGRNSDILGVTSPEGGGYFSRLRSKVYIAPGLKGHYYSGMNATNLTVNHEVMHAYHTNFFRMYDKYSERATTHYSYLYAKAYGMKYWVRQTERFVNLDYPSLFSWRRFANLGIFKVGIK